MRMGTCGWWRAMLMVVAGLAVLAGPAVGTAAEANMLLMGGNGGVYFLAEPGPLVVDVVKLELSAPTELRAVLVGPDRRPVAEQRIEAGPGRQRGVVTQPQVIRLTTQVERKGVYVLLITAAGDRYGTRIAWGFSSNCPKYMIETARGHRDEAHQEPIILHSPDQPASIWFQPAAEGFQIEVTKLPKGVEQLTLHDARGQLIQNLAVTEGQAQAQIGPEPGRGAAPWRLHLPKGSGTIQIDGLTRWRPQDTHRDMAIWTTNGRAWFDLLPNRWLLTPYSRKVYGEPGSSGEMTYTVHNNGKGRRVFQLTLEPGAGTLQARLSTSHVTVAAGKTAEVTIHYTVAAEGRGMCHLRATPVDRPAFSTYSTLEVVAGPSPAREPLAMPLVLKPYEHENEQFGYLPDYPTDWEIYHDMENRPYGLTDRGLMALRDGGWELIDLRKVVTVAGKPEGESSFTMGRSSTKIAFDRDNDMYLVSNTSGRGALLHSRDGGRSFTAYDLGPSGAFDIEQFSGHNVPTGAPWLLRSITTERDPKLRWRQLSTLELIPVEKRGGKLEIGQPIELTRLALGVGAHSGIASAIVSREGRVHAIWGEATDPSLELPGVPAYVVSCDRQTRKLLGEPVLIGYGAPANDTHNRPSITMDSKGYLHALTGTHNATFNYARSLEPNNAHGGWTEAEPVGEPMRQTYIGLVCAPDDTLHLINRQFLYETEPHKASHHAVLAHQIKRPGQPWEAPRVLIIPPLSEYSIYYHRLTVDRAGRLLLSYDYWSTMWFYRNDHRGKRRTSIISDDGGQSWRFLFTDDLLGNIR